VWDGTDSIIAKRTLGVMGNGQGSGIKTRNKNPE